MLFQNLQNLIDIVLLGSAAYLGAIVLLRLSGNRTLSKLNSFDLVVTIAFGSTLSTTLINRSVTLAEGLVAIGLLIGLQFIVAWLCVRTHWMNWLVKTRPTLVLENGQYCRDAMKTVRVTEDDIRAAVRKKGYGDLNSIAAVVLESDGSLSVIPSQQAGSSNSLEGVSRQE